MLKFNTIALTNSPQSVTALTFVHDDEKTYETEKQSLHCVALTLLAEKSDAVTSRFSKNLHLKKKTSINQLKMSLPLRACF